MRQLTLQPELLKKLEPYRPGLFALAGLAIGILSWTIGLTGLAAIFPALWLTAKSRKEAWWLAFCYYLSGSWVIPGASAAFFGADNSANIGLLMWTTSAALLALPWGLAPRRMLGLLFVILMVSLPPLGLIGWLNPLLSAADIFPGSKAFGFIAVIALWWVADLGLRNQRAWPGIAIFLFVLSAVCHVTYHPLRPPMAWRAVDTEFGKPPVQLVGMVNRQLQVIDIARKALDSGAQVVLLPEQVAGWFDEGMLSVWRRELAHYPWRERQMLLVGAEKPIKEGDKPYRNTLAAWFSGDFLGYVSARQTVPVSMWKPWAKKGEEHVPMDWFKLNLMPVPLAKENKMVATVFCYEEFLVFPLLTTLAIEKPYAILSVVNGWWASPDEQRLQRQHVEAWAKLFNLPLLRAVNR